MPFIEWTEQNKTNVKKCDDQHKKLFDIVNNLYDGMKSGQGRTVMGNVLNELIDYTVYHFKTEEDLMKKYSYPGLLLHIKEHENLMKKAGELKQRFDRGESVISVEVMEFLKEWLTKHTSGSDKKYGQFLNGKGVF
ncbi:MAG: bacteriohemerythrin [Syntrophorhabdaceae bacterium]|nr:bacteriohemerythrin [Syntrophorhabdaceae bacterium]